MIVIIPSKPHARAPVDLEYVHQSWIGVAADHWYQIKSEPIEPTLNTESLAARLIFEAAELVNGVCPGVSFWMVLPAEGNHSFGPMVMFDVPWGIEMMPLKIRIP